jgi:hypothetical protein
MRRVYRLAVCTHYQTNRPIVSPVGYTHILTCIYPAKVFFILVEFLSLSLPPLKTKTEIIRERENIGSTGSGWNFYFLRKKTKKLKQKNFFFLSL